MELRTAQAFSVEGMPFIRTDTVDVVGKPLARIGHAVASKLNMYYGIDAYPVVEENANVGKLFDHDTDELVGFFRFTT